jgi:hypothetical protein
MARDTLTVIEIGAWGGKSEDIDDNLTTGTGANDLQFLHPGGNVFLYIEETAASPITTTVDSVASARTFNRTGDTVASTSASKKSLINIPDHGFTQSDGYVHIDFTEDTTKFAVFKLVPTPR